MRDRLLKRFCAVKILPARVLEMYFPYLLTACVSWAKMLWNFPESLFLRNPELPVVLIEMVSTKPMLQKKKWAQAHGKKFEIVKGLQINIVP